MGGRRVKGEGSAYQRASDGRWCFAIDIPDSTRRRRKVVTARSLAELRPLMLAARREVQAGVVTDATTVQEWMDYWLAHEAPLRARPYTLAKYRSIIRTWVTPTLGAIRLSALRADHIRRLYGAMTEQGRSTTTQRQVHAILHRALKVAQQQGKVTRNAAGDLDPPRPADRHHGKLTLHQGLTLIAHLADEPLAARWLVGMLCGLRQGEALGLRRQDVDLDNGVLHVRGALQRQTGRGMVYVAPKSERSARRVQLVPIVAGSIAEYLRRNPRAPDEYLWARDDSDDRKAWRDLLFRAGLPHVPLHAARATFASLLDEAGASPKVIAEMMGHATPVITQRAYIHGDDDRHAAAIGALAALLGSAH